MKQKIVLFIACLLVANFLLAQTVKYTLKLENQYQAEVPQATISILNSDKKFTTNNRGIAEVTALSTDIFVIQKDHYQSDTIAYQAIQSKTVITIHKNFTWKDLLTPMFYILNGGLWLLLFIIFAETGLFVGFFLPGDSLLFVAGIFSNNLAASLYDTGNSFLNLLLITVLITIAGIAGNATGYWFGRRIGPTMFHWKDNFLFKKKYLHQAHDFYEKHGGGAVVFARFIPIVRTFAPIVAGIVEMDKKKFTFFNITGCIAWVGSMLAAGHYLDKFFLEHYHFDIKKHLEIIVLVIVFITTAPVLVKLIFGKAKPRKES